MIFRETEFKMKDGRDALLRSPGEEDAEEMLQFIIRATGETDFLLKCPEEYADFTLDQEKSFINEICHDQNRLMITCLVDGKIAGNCQISFRTGMKERHRASVAIALLKESAVLSVITVGELTKVAGTISSISFRVVLQEFSIAPSGRNSQREWKFSAPVK